MPLLRDLLVKLIDAVNPRVFALAVGFVGFATLSIFHVFDRKTELEEHGLIVGFARPEFSFQDVDSVVDIVGTVANSLEGGLSSGDSELSSSVDPRLAATERQRRRVVDLFQRLDAAASDTETVFWPISEDAVLGESATVGFATVVGAARGDGRESLALVFAEDWSRGPNPASVQLGLGLLQYLAKVKWMARDVVGLFVDSGKEYAAGRSI